MSHVVRAFVLCPLVAAALRHGAGEKVRIVGVILENWIVAPVVMGSIPITHPLGRVHVRFAVLNLFRPCSLPFLLYIIAKQIAKGYDDDYGKDSIRSGKRTKLQRSDRYAMG